LRQTQTGWRAVPAQLTGKAMNFKAFTRSLASSLQSQAWQLSELQFHLEQRLPPPKRQAAAAIAENLLQAFQKPYAPARGKIAVCLESDPEAGRLFKYAQKHQTWPAQWIAPQQFRPSPSFEALPLPRLVCETELADWLALDLLQLTRFADLKGLSNRTVNAFAPHYKFHIHSKKNGGLRLIEEPKPALKRLQRRILSGILDHVPPSPQSFGFVAGRNCIQAAARHAGEEVVACFDLQSFFPSVRAARIHGLFRCLGYPEAVARALTGLCTLKTPAQLRARLPVDSELLARRHLPQGAPTSPALANLCCFNLDRRLASLARSLDANFSRYADDLTFSGDRSIIKPLLRAVPGIAADEGFRLNPVKTRVSLSHQAQTCTGLTVNRKVNIPRRDYDRLKSAIHRLKEPDNPDRCNPLALDRLAGRIAWTETVNPAKGAKLRARFEAALSAGH